MPTPRTRAGRGREPPASRVLSDDRLRELAGALVTVPGVVGVVLGGSRARGDHTPESDLDLGLCYVPPLDLVRLQQLARDVAGPSALVTAPGAWGPWVDGGGWLTVDGTAVDWIYRDLERVRGCWADALAGRYSFHAQTGHPLGVPDFAYPGELALGRVLADPTGTLSALQEQTRSYPPALGAALVDGLWEAGFLLELAAKAVSRADTAYVGGCLFRAVLLCAHAVHGRAGRWLVNEKGAVTAAGRLPGAPPMFAELGHAVLAAPARSAASLQAAIDLAADLLERTRSACR